MSISDERFRGVHRALVERLNNDRARFSRFTRRKTVHACDRERRLLAFLVPGPSSLGCAASEEATIFDVATEPDVAPFLHSRQHERRRSIQNDGFRETRIVVDEEHGAFVEVLLAQRERDLHLPPAENDAALFQERCLRVCVHMGGQVYTESRGNDHMYEYDACICASELTTDTYMYIHSKKEHTTRHRGLEERERTSYIHLSDAAAAAGSASVSFEAAFTRSDATSLALNAR